MMEKYYIVRIYRQDGKTARDAVINGVVEVTDTGERKSFHDIESLWKVLSGVNHSVKWGVND